jgi:hypothetical protein
MPRTPLIYWVLRFGWGWLRPVWQSAGRWVTGGLSGGDRLVWSANAVQGAGREWLGGRARSGDGPAAGLVMQPEACESGEVDRAGSSDDVGEDTGLAAGSGLAAAPGSAGEVGDLAFHRRPGGSIGLLPVGVVLGGLGLLQPGLVGMDGDRPARPGGAADRLDQARAGDAVLVIGTTPFVGEGFDAPVLDTLFLAAPISFDGLLVQCAGRVVRAAPGKDLAEVHHYHDPAVPLIAGSLRRRLPGIERSASPGRRKR